MTATVLVVPAAAPVTAAPATPVSAAPAADPTISEPLDILLVNDDGWRGPGGAATPLIVALRDALESAGHHVVVVAPATDQSGQGGRFSLPPTQLTVANPEEDVWTVSPGSPADSVFFGMAELFPDGAPDLVISGINPGLNVGQAANHSGTVNASSTALEFGVPSIAVSLQARPDWPAGILVGTPGAADYVVDLVRRIQHVAGKKPLMPAGAMLNVNLPLRPGPIDPATGQPGSALPPEGERITTLAGNLGFRFDYHNVTGADGTPGTYAIGLVPETVTPAPDSDIRAIGDGYVSLTPMEADRDVDGSTKGWLASLL